MPAAGGGGLNGRAPVFAVAVRDAGGASIASLNVSAPRFLFVERVAAAGQELLAVSAELSRQLGDPEA